ncbi:serine/threonine protein kinase [Chondromyces crocatus]|uniref:non-specific serine/threonine protein kinase n=1 Tax=Chondromyces crocatus TaxID=52 RepID=A0A0K1EBP8_CHOCO|nr:serine/threonine-protein kinase [Chondromyces crocatus]AKT38003.1 protein kinase [Chondromyces crocatus]
MPLDATFRTTTIQAFAVTQHASGEGSITESGSAAVSVRTSDPGSSPRGPSILPESGQIVGGLYRLVRLLGQGMFGKVYVAQRIDVPEHQVALKLLPRSHYATRNVERELVMLATIGHPNVVQLKDHGMTADYVWLTMSVYDGETLEERLARGPLGLREAYDVFVPVARGLEALHAAGLRHQDVKPDNIYLARFGGRVHPVLLDLGVAAEREATFCAGTALFASPEQLGALNAYPGAVHLDEKMDTYCLAATLLVALVGGERFPGERARTRDELEAAQAARATTPLASGTLPEVVGAPRDLLEASLQRWLALDATQRPSMAQMAEELEVLLEPEREKARKEEERIARQRAALHRLRIAAAGLLLVAVAGALLIFSKRETLRVANELERARRQGEESFSKLDTCVASHRLSEQRNTDCQQAREHDRAELKQAILAVERSGSASAADHAREINNLQAAHATRLKACEDEATADAASALDEQERLEGLWERERSLLVLERDIARDQAEDRAAKLASIAEERRTCEAERTSCEAERERYKASAPPTLSPVFHPSLDPLPDPAPTPSSSASAVPPEPLPIPSPPSPPLPEPPPQVAPQPSTQAAPRPSSQSAPPGAAIDVTKQADPP